ncbi:MAG: GHKL domain-containing protein [Methylovulum sp.]|jgi:two-component system sensor histidine kinase PhoQ|nr:GHKL domain-containing protein [Methylovulum sp.]MCF7998701.1 GHKL domain-containing protein [Methylovulum sp.]
MHSKSLRFRLLIAEGLVLAIFFALVALILEQGFRDTAEEALQERLQIQIYSLLAAAKVETNGELIMPDELPDPRFATPGSGLYGFIQQAPAKRVWQSPSAIGLAVESPEQLEIDQFKFLFEKQKRYALHYAVSWPKHSNNPETYLISVEEDARFVSDQLEQLQKTLRLWLLVIAIVLIAMQFALLRWSLTPLRRIAEDLAAIEQGHKTHLDGQYPSELRGLVGNLNAFISIERAHLERYRNNLADLAHSLKTPLAILRGCLESFPPHQQETVSEQIVRMDEIVEYQLHRAAAKGEQKTIKTQDLTVIIHKISASLNKVYLDKAIQFVLTVPEFCPIYAEEGDLYEIVGNLMDNACKWCQHSVKVSITLKPRKARRDFSALLTIEDDGPGIPVGKFNDILKRGMRADENIHGHGIGVSVVNELLDLLGGKLEGGSSVSLGGMQWSVYLP